nr:VCBS repeat-containing protein [Myxococcota bacterium]
GDTNPDLVVGQAGGPLAAWLGEPGGTGSFLPADAVVPPVPLDVVALTLADADGDFDPDLAVAVRGAGMRLYVDREGHLEDQSFVRLPQPAPRATAIAFGGWDTGCEPDAVIAAATESSALRGEPGGALVADAAGPGASDVVMVDLDDDGDLDAVLATPEGVRWFAR